MALIPPAEAEARLADIRDDLQRTRTDQCGPLLDLILEANMVIRRVNTFPEDVDLQPVAEAWVETTESVVDRAVSDGCISESEADEIREGVQKRATRIGRNDDVNRKTIWGYEEDIVINIWPVSPAYKVRCAEEHVNPNAEGGINRVMRTEMAQGNTPISVSAGGESGLGSQTGAEQDPVICVLFQRAIDSALED